MQSLKTLLLVRGALVVLALVLFTTACGGDATDDAEVGIATLADVEEPVEDEVAMGDGGIAEGEPEPEEPEPEDSESEEPKEERTIEDASLDFAACMREERISAWPDPTPGLKGGQPFSDVDFAALGIDPTDQDFLDTVNTCRAEFEGVADGREALSPEEEAERRDTEIAMAECIRGNPGWEDFPDPDPNGGGFEQVREAVLNGEIDFAALVPVLQDCASQLGVELPGGRQGGQGG